MPNLNTGTIQRLGRATTSSYDADACGCYNVRTTVNNLVAEQTFSVTRTSVNTPMYHHWGGGPLPFNNFSFEKKHFTDHGGHENYTQNRGIVITTCGTRTGYYSSDGTGVGYCPSIADYYNSLPTPLTSVEISALDHEATNKVLTKVKDMRVNLAQFYAEREQMIEMFRETITQIASSIRAMKKGDVVGAAEHLGIPVGSRRQRAKIIRRHKSRVRATSDSLADRWLALQYGWKPLLSDVAGMAESVAKALNNHDNYVATGRKAHRVTRDFLKETIKDSLGGSADGVVKVEGIHEISYELRYTPDSASRPLVELGILNPLELAWELLPYSFVVDWFADVGNSISALDATVGCTFKSGIRTEFKKWTFESMGSRRGKFSSGNTYQNSTRRCTFNHVKVTRTVLNGFPQASPPIIKDKRKWFTDIHIANSLALFNNIFRK